MTDHRIYCGFCQWHTPLLPIDEAERQWKAHRCPGLLRYRAKLEDKAAGLATAGR